MPLYFNENHSKGVVQLGPYTFKGGYYRTSVGNDSTIGPILTTFYGCRRLTDEEEAAKNKEWAAKKNPTSDLSDEEKANIQRELEEKLKAETAAKAKAKEEAEAKAKEEAEAKTKAESKS